MSLWNSSAKITLKAALTPNFGAWPNPSADGSPKTDLPGDRGLRFFAAEGPAHSLADAHDLMLAHAQQYHVLVSYWWMLLPGLLPIPVFLAYHSLAEKLQERLKSNI